MIREQLSNPLEHVEGPKDKGHERPEKAGREASDGRQKFNDNQKEEDAMNKAGKARGGTRTWDRPFVPSGQFPEQIKIASLVEQKDLAKATGLANEQVAEIEHGPGSAKEKLKKEQTYFEDLAGELRKGWEWNKKDQTLTFDLTQAHGGIKDSGVVSIPVGDTVLGDWLSKRPLQDRQSEKSSSGADRFEAYRGALEAAQKPPGEQPILIAQGLDNQNVRTDATNATREPFQLGITKADFANIVDQNGEVPFGEPLHGGVSDSKIKAQNYFATTIGYETTTKNGNVRDDVININIGDHMVVNGQSVLDGKPHRAVFPINAQGGGHFHWVDATIQYGRDKKGHPAMEVEIHKISASKDKPTSESQWNEIGKSYPLAYLTEPQHVPAGDYLSLYRLHDKQPTGDWYKAGHYYQLLKFNEKDYE
jgi:hypothetical protein